MGMTRGKTACAVTVGCALGAVALTGCAAPPPAASSEPGTHLMGTVQLLAGSDENCWAVRFDEDGTTVEAPLAVPDGYSASDTVAMADPLTGSNYATPALLNAAGELVGFTKTGVYVAGTFASLDNPALADERARCGWESAPLVAEPGGIWIDPDGLTTAVVTCTAGSDDGTLPEGAEDPSRVCTTEQLEPWNWE